MEDQVLQCVECNDEWTYTAEEQNYIANKGYSAPKRCKPCRAKKRARFDERDIGKDPREEGDY